MITECFHSIFTRSKQQSIIKGLDSTLVSKGPVTLSNISNQDYIYIKDSNLKISKNISVNLGQFYTEKQILKS
jgi:hypothetical protein